MFTISMMLAVSPEFRGLSLFGRLCKYPKTRNNLPTNYAAHVCNHTPEHEVSIAPPCDLAHDAMAYENPAFVTTKC